MSDDVKRSAAVEQLLAYWRQSAVTRIRTVVVEQTELRCADELETARAAAAALDAAPRSENVLSNLGDLRTEVGTVLRQLALTMHRADALPPADYVEKPTVADWRGRAEWLAAVLTKTMARLEDEHLAHLRLAADGGAVARPPENVEDDPARSPSTATPRGAGSTARADGDT